MSDPLPASRLSLDVAAEANRVQTYSFSRSSLVIARMYAIPAGTRSNGQIHVGRSLYLNVKRPVASGRSLISSSTISRPPRSSTGAADPFTAT